MNADISEFFNRRQFLFQSRGHQDKLKIRQTIRNFFHRNFRPADEWKIGGGENENTFHTVYSCDSWREAHSCYPSRFLKSSIVLFSPSSNDTAGSHPSNFFASEISGRRCFGSSSGNGCGTITLAEQVSASAFSASPRMVNSEVLPRLIGPMMVLSEFI